MSSQGGGKARDKRSHRSKPYERRQGLLGRLTGTVTRLLPESWVPAWLQDEPDVPEPRPGPATRRNHLNAVVTPDTWTGSPSVSSVQPREDEDGRLMADAGGGAGLAPRVSGPPGWSRAIATTEDGAGPSSWSAGPALARGTALGPTPGLDESMARKRRRRQLQQEDDSELSDDSGPAAAAPAVAPAAAPAPAPAQVSSSTASAAGSSRGRPQPAALSSKRPRFNASALNTSLMSQDESAGGSLNRSGAGLSPFYPGPTVYGGAASHRRLRVPQAASSGPYQVRPRAVSARAADDASMSTTARRILTVLEGMSTPVSDARRVPIASPGDRLLNCSLDGQRRAGLYGAHGARLGRRRPEHPPVHHVVPPVKVTVEPNRSLSAAPAPVEDSASRRVTFSSQPTPPAAAAAAAEPRPLSAAGTAAAAPTPSASTGGKMRRQKERGHYSSRPEADPGELPPSPEPLPDVSLPFMHIKPISLTTSTPKVPSADVRRSAAAAGLSENGAAEFTFSSPLVVCPAAGAGLVNGLADGADEPTFSFSAPSAVADRVAAAPAPAVGPGSSSTGSSWGDKFKRVAGTRDCDTGMVSSKPDAVECVASQTPGGAAAKVAQAPAAPAKTSPAPAAPVTSSWGDKFKPAAGTWSCDVCMVSNKPEATKCVACQTPGGSVAKADPPAAKPAVAAAPAITSSWGDKFKPPAGQWTCDTCMLSNKAEASKCAACETPNASGKPAPPPASNSKLSAEAKQFTPSSSWGDTSMVSNKTEAAKRVACETPNPSGAATATSAATGAAAKSADWECSTCLVRNKPAISKCAACESPRPESRTKDSTPYQFGASKPSAGAFSFGFGAKKSDAGEATKPVTSGFVFGADSSKASEAKSSESKTSSTSGFAFGGSSSDKPAASTAAAAFSFGFSSGSGTPSSDNVGAKTSSPAAKAPVMNFGTGSGSSPASLKRKLPEPAAEKAVPELKTGNVMDLLGGGGSTSVAKPTETKNGSGEETKSASKPTVLPANGGFSFGAAASSAPVAAGSAMFTFGSGSQLSGGGGGAAPSAATVTFGETAAKKPTEPAKSDAMGVADKPPALFSFGANSSGASDKPNAGFVFGAGPGTTVQDGASKVATSAASGSSAGFSFGAPKTSEQASASGAGFTFGAKTSDSSTQPTTVFAFGASAKPSDSTEKPTSAGFSFGTKAPESSDKPSATFSFGSGSAVKPADKTSPATFSFGSKAAESADKPAAAPFAFGSGSAAAPVTAKPAGVFAFGSTGSGAAPAAGGFSFGTPSSGSNSGSAGGGLALGAAPAVTKADSTPTFVFGATSNGPAAKKTASEEKPAPAGVFQFGSGSAPAVAAGPFGAAASAPAPAAASGPFAMGAAKSTTPATFSFGSSAPAATTPFAFGSGQPAAPTPASAPAPAPGVFAFGQSGSQPPAAAAPPFGGSAFGQSATPAAPTAGFAFGASSTPSFNFSGGQQAAPAAAPGAGGVFRFGAPTAGASALAPAPPTFGAAAPSTENPFSATPATLAGRKIRTAKRRTVKK